MNVKTLIDNLSKLNPDAEAHIQYFAEGFICDSGIKNCIKDPHNENIVFILGDLCVSLKENI